MVELYKEKGLVGAERMQTRARILKLKIHEVYTTLKNITASKGFYNGIPLR